MSNFILTKGRLVVLLTCTCLLLAGQAMFSYAIESHRTLTTAQCTVQSTAVVSGSVGLKLLCNGVQRQLTDARVVVSYLKNPGDIECRVHALNISKCKARSD